MMRFTKSLLIFGLAALAGGMTSCKDNDDDNKGPGATEQIPASYNFSNVTYTGQTARLLLTDTLANLVKGVEKIGGKAVTKADLEKIYDNTGGYYSHISTNKKLSDKMSGGAVMDKQMRDWFDTIATRSAMYAGSAKGVTTEDGLHLPQFIEKTIMGGVFYSQAIQYIEDKVPTADNNTVKDGEGTTMEHYWDEAFGYFGAAREYNKFSDAEIAANPSQKDLNNDGKIDIKTEKNFFFARYAGSRDNDANKYAGGPKDFTSEIFNGFIKGRYYIGKKEYAKRDEAARQVLSAWDKVIAASAIKYADDCKNSLGNPVLLNAKWAELKTFMDMTQYNNSNKLGTANYQAVKALIGNKPSDVNTEKLNEIIAKIKTAYGF